MRVSAALALALTALLLSLAACQTVEETAEVEPARNFALRRNDAPTGAIPVADNRSQQATFLEGTGRFVGDQPDPKRRSAEANDDGVTLNLVGVPTSQAAKTILGDLLAVRYTVDPSIEGKITIQTPRPVTKSAAVDLFQSALRANGAAVINTAGAYKIVPIEQAALGARLQLDGTAEAGQTLGSAVRVVQLNYVAASEMRRVLEPIAPRGGIVRTDDARNIITLSGSGQDLASMLEAISVFDVDVMKGMSFALVPVKSSQPDALADELRTIFATDREGPMAGMVQFLPNKRLGAILIVSPQPRYLRRGEEWVRRLDQHAQGTEKQLYTYSVQNRLAQDLVDVLQGMFSSEIGGGSRAASSTRNVTPRSPEVTAQSSASSGPSGSSTGGLGGMKGFTTPVSQVSATPSPARPTQTAAAGMGGPLVPPPSSADQGQADPRIKIAADEGKNAVLIEATPDDYRRVLRAISTLDTMARQVLIEAAIAEVTLNDGLKFGVPASGNVTPGRLGGTG